MGACVWAPQARREAERAVSDWLREAWGRLIAVFSRGGTMQPGQLEPNEFELAVLARISEAEPSIRPLIGGLHVLSREYTGVGSYTKFRCDPDGSRGHLDMKALISMPGVPNGMGAILWCQAGRPESLETFTYGDDDWNGVFTGFKIEAAAQQPREAEARQ